MCCLYAVVTYSQELQSNSKGSSLKKGQIVDLKYREDQFYLGVTHTLMQDRPEGYTASSVSPGIFLGFLRDMPINKRRTHAIAPGFGYGYNKYNGSLKLLGIDEVVEERKHNLTMHKVEFPLELRWRSSTPESHKFWRVYLGVKASYVFQSKVSDVSNLATSSFTGVDTNKWLYDMYISAGFNTWNFYASYGFTELYKSSMSASQKANFKTISLGLVFYIL